MKNMIFACVALMLVAATAKAGDLAVSKSTLGSMGLGSMHSLSDDAGTAVRGKGTSASVFGGSTATFTLGHGQNASVQQSVNNYQAGASWIGKDSSAAGGSLSFAGKVNVAFAQDPTGSQLSVSATVVVAGGGAFATAH